MRDDLWQGAPEGATVAAVTVCRACEDLIGRFEDGWPGGDADRALERLRSRIDSLLERGPRPPDAGAAAASCSPARLSRPAARRAPAASSLDRRLPAPGATPGCMSPPRSSGPLVA